MFQCIGCAKPPVDDDDVDEQVRGENGTPRAVKSLTAQIKDMALKFTGRHKGSSSTYQRGLRSNPDSDSNSEGVQHPYMGGVSLGSTPSRDQRFIIGGTSTGNQTPRRHHLVEIPPGTSGLLPEYEPNQWMSQVEPGVHVTLISLPNGENELKRIRFDREMFNKRRAQIWWGQNYDRLMELYNVRRFNNQALSTPPNSEDEERDFPYSRQPSARDSPVAAWLNNDANFRNQYSNPPGFTMDHGSSNLNMPAAGSSVDASTIFAGDELSFSNANHEIVGEWIEQDEPGVFVTIKVLADGTKELRRVKFSRQRFGNDDAKIWWEANKERIQAEYL